MALAISTDRNVQDVTGHEGLKQLEWLQAQVGGYIEQLTFLKPVVYMDQTFHAMMLNEEGKLEGLPLNSIATLIATEGGLVGDSIVGNIILFANGEID